jgi:DNA-binding GntR family transcriptional regulator
MTRFRGVVIDHERGGPVWMQLAAILRKEVATMASGDILPSVRTLVQTYGVSDQTVKHALAKLRDEGLIVTYHGKGSYVA